MKKNMRPVVFCVFHLLWTLRSYSLKELLQEAFVGQWIDFWRATLMIINNFIHGCTVVPAAFCKQLFFETSVTLYYTLSVCHSPLQFMNRQKPSGSVLESGNKLKVWSQYRLSLLLSHLASRYLMYHCLNWYQFENMEVNEFAFIVLLIHSLVLFVYR